MTGSDEDYIDAGCRILARAALDDVEWLVAELQRLRGIVAAVRDEIADIRARANLHPPADNYTADQMDQIADDLEAALAGEDAG